MNNFLKLGIACFIIGLSSASHTVSFEEFRNDLHRSAAQKPIDERPFFVSVLETKHVIFTEALNMSDEEKIENELILQPGRPLDEHELRLRAAFVANLHHWCRRNWQI